MVSCAQTPEELGYGRPFLEGFSVENGCKEQDGKINAAIPIVERGLLLCLVPTAAFPRCVQHEMYPSSVKITMSVLYPNRWAAIFYFFFFFYFEETGNWQLDFLRKDRLNLVCSFSTLTDL